MKKVIYHGETYYYSKGKIYDDTFIEVPVSVSSGILDGFFNTIDHKVLEESEFVTLVKELKLAEKYNRCLKTINYGLKKFTESFSYYQVVFPIITSCYRALGQPQKAIDFWERNKRLFSSCLTVPLLTSLAAAYCDVGDYEKATKCANRAYAMQGGAQSGSTELSGVYGRIKKETGEKYRFN